MFNYRATSKVHFCWAYKGINLFKHNSKAPLSNLKFNLNQMHGKFFSEISETKAMAAIIFCTYFWNIVYELRDTLFAVKYSADR